ncbi:hypothetical protein [Nocardioides pantholopis]|uniref:hypothetical protein n=1 Tax=Nocardioides pantholopis TaxID=2483798 RepID=UPI000F08DF05|nr:hypothetical protein [Nocardioides pantholopis]
MLISVLGTGYLGAAHAACLAALGHPVIGVDADRALGRSLGRALGRSLGWSLGRGPAAVG